MMGMAVSGNIDNLCSDVMTGTLHTHVSGVARGGVLRVLKHLPEINIIHTTYMQRGRGWG